MKKIWKDIKGYEGNYELSRHLDITRGCAWYRRTQGLEIDGIKYGIQ